MGAVDRTRDIRSADAFERAFVVLFAAMAGASAVAMVLAWIGQFRPILLIPLGITAAVVCAGAVIRSSSAVGHRRPSLRAVVACLALTVVSGGLFLRPAEYVFDGSDGSVYHAMAAILERHGTFHPRDALASSLTQPELSAVFPRSVVSGQLERFPGGLQMEADQQLRPEFLHLFPVWMAAAGSTFGTWSRGFVNPVIAVLAVLALWLLGRRLAGPLAGEIAAVLLTANLAQIYFARFPSSEITAQFLIVAGLFLAVLALDTAWTPAAVGAGTAFGLAAFARIDALMIAAPVVACWLAIAILRGQYDRPTAWMARAFGTVTFAAVLYAFTSADAYTHRLMTTSLTYLDDQPARWVVIGLAGLVVIVFAAVVAITRGLFRLLLPVMATGAAALVGWLIWKDLSQGYFASLVSPPGLVLAVAGCAAMLSQRASTRAWLVAGLFFAGMLYFGNPMDQRVLPWNLRRYVPIVLPLACVGVAYAVAMAARRRGPARAIIAIPAFIVVWFVVDAGTLIANPVMRNGDEELAKVRDATTPASLLIWDSGMPSHLPMATQYHLGRESVIVRPGEAFATTMPGIVAAWLARGRDVQLVTNERLDTLQRAAWRDWLGVVSISRASSIQIQSEVLRATGDGIDLRVAHPQRPLDFYTLRPPAPEPLPLRMDIGGPDLPFLLAGFHAAERNGAMTFRWTAGEAQVFVPAVWSSRGRAARLSIRAAAGRPSSPAPVVLDVALNERMVGQIPLTPDFAEHHVELGSDVFDAPSRLTLRVPTFVPRAGGGSDDGRTLGVLLDWIAIEPGAPTLMGSLELATARPGVVGRR